MSNNKHTSWVTLSTPNAQWFETILNDLDYTTILRSHPTKPNHSTLTIFGTTAEDLSTAYDLFLEVYDRTIN